MLRATPFLFKSAPKSAMDSVADAAKSVVETMRGAGAASSKQDKHAEASNENSSVGENLGAAKDAAGDEVNETTNRAKAAAHKQKSKME